MPDISSSSSTPKRADSQRHILRSFYSAIAPQSLVGKISRLWNLRKRLYPISDWEWWCVVFRWMIHPNPPNAPYRLSRLTRITFLLDPGAYYVWPHPRIEDYPAWRNVGTALARLLVTLRNPGLEARIIEHLDAKTNGKTPAELEDQVNAVSSWRYRMFVSYGDKWPKDASPTSLNWQLLRKPKGRQDKEAAEATIATDPK